MTTLSLVRSWVVEPGPIATRCQGRGCERVIEPGARVHLVANDQTARDRPLDPRGRLYLCERCTNLLEPRVLTIQPLPAARGLTKHPQPF